MAKDYLLGIDAGTSLVKAVIFDLKGKEISISSTPVGIETPQLGWAEQDMDLVWKAVVQVIRTVGSHFIPWEVSQI